MAASDIDILRFKHNMDRAIAVANREIIHPLIPDITRDLVLPLALSVARYAVVIFKRIRDRRRSRRCA